MAVGLMTAQQWLVNIATETLTPVVTGAPVPVTPLDSGQSKSGWRRSSVLQGGLSMADKADDAQAVAEMMTEAAIKKVLMGGRKDTPAGVQGECDLCGEWSGRLVEGACAPCRDHYGLG